jgi:hypothetical protein
MNARSSRMRDVRAWTGLSVVLALAACRVGPAEEITSTKPYADLIGAKYSVVADKLYAYGVYESLDNKSLSYVTLIPPPGVGGPEFAFRRHIPKGQVITIVSAWRHFILLESGVYYLVALGNSDLPQGTPIRLELSRGNEGVGADLNPAIYRKLPRGN